MNCRRGSVCRGHCGSQLIFNKEDKVEGHRFFSIQYQVSNHDNSVFVENNKHIPLVKSYVHLLLSVFRSEQNCTCIMYIRMYQLNRSLPTLMTSEQPRKYAYRENENNQKRHFFFLQNSECFWIKFELCL